MDIVIGKVLKPQGVKGEIKVLPITDDPGRFYDLESVYCGKERKEIVSCRVREGVVYLRFAGNEDRNAAEALRDMELSVLRKQATKLPEDSWFVADLVGCTVRDNTGQELGVVSDILQNGSVDVYVVDDGKLMFPALKRVLLQVDVECQSIVVDALALLEVAVYAD